MENDSCVVCWEKANGRSVCKANHSICLACLFRSSQKLYSVQGGQVQTDTPRFIYSGLVKHRCPLCRQDDIIVDINIDDLKPQSPSNITEECPHCHIPINEDMMNVHRTNCQMMQGICPWCKDLVTIGHIHNCDRYSVQCGMCNIFFNSTANFRSHDCIPFQAVFDFQQGGADHSIEILEEQDVPPPTPPSGEAAPGYPMTPPRRGRRRQAIPGAPRNVRRRQALHAAPETPPAQGGRGRMNLSPLRLEE